MKRFLAIAFVLCVGSGWKEVKWPDPEIFVPPLVLEFIDAECDDHTPATGEGRAACVEGEKAGYRATVMMLIAPETGERAAERYRACAAGLRMAGGRFHRRRAECIGHTIGYHWRFEHHSRARLREGSHSYADAHPRQRASVALADGLERRPAFVAE